MADKKGNGAPGVYIAMQEGKPLIEAAPDGKYKLRLRVGITNPTNHEQTVNLFCQGVLIDTLSIKDSAEKEYTVKIREEEAYEVKVEIAGANKFYVLSLGKMLPTLKPKPRDVKVEQLVVHVGKVTPTGDNHVNIHVNDESGAQIGGEITIECDTNYQIDGTPSPGITTLIIPQTGRSFVIKVAAETIATFTLTPVGITQNRKLKVRP